MAMTSLPPEPPPRLTGAASAAPPAAAPAGPPPAADVPWFLDVAEIMLTLRARLAWVLVPTAAAIVLALAALLLLPHRYTASSELLIDPQGLQIVKGDLSPPGQASDASLLLVDSQLQVVSSDDVLRRVVEQFRLDRDSEFVSQAGVVGQTLGALNALLRPTLPAQDLQLEALRSLRQRLVVRRLERTFALMVSVTTDDRDKSARLAQAVADTYLVYDQQTRAALAERAGDAIRARLGELQAEVRDAEDQAQTYRAAHNLVGTRTQLVSEQQLGQIGDQLGAARARAADQLARLNQIDAILKGGGPLESLPEVLQSPTVSQLRTQLAQAERTLADRATTLGPRHPAMVAAQSDVRAAQAQLKAEVGRIAASVRNAYKTAAANAADLSSTMDQGKTEAVTVGDALVHLRELERQIDARRSVYETFLVRARELQAQQQVGTSASRIISPATPPARRDGPPATVLLGAATLAGLGLGVAAAMTRERTSGRIRTAGRLAQRLGLPVAGALPPMPDTEEPVHATLEGRYDLAVMRLRNHLWQASPSKRVIVVTAADAVSRKARLAMRLAVLAAADHDQILLVDADPDSSLPADFDLPIAPITTRALEGRAVLPERGVAQLPGLRYMSVSRHSARLDFRSVADSILSRAAHFDAVIVNAGLLGADLFTERFAADPRVTVVLVAASASEGDFAVLDRALATVERPQGVVMVLTQASDADL